MPEPQPKSSRGEKSAERHGRRTFLIGGSILNRINLWYVAVGLAILYTYIFLQSRQLHHLLGTDVSVQVLQVVDGDTFVGKTFDGYIGRFRLRQIDAPEFGQPYAMEARRALETLLDGDDRDVIVFLWEVDSWGRYVVDTVTRDSIFTNLTHVQMELVSRGLAWAFGGFGAKTALQEAMDSAKQQKLGLWGDSNPVEPWIYRREKRDGQRRGSGWGDSDPRSLKPQERSDHKNRNRGGQKAPSSSSRGRGSRK